MRRIIFSAALAVLALPALADLGCAGTAGGKRFAFEARAGGVERTDSGAPLTFANETGWQITLTKADVTIGPIYLNTIPPLRDQTQSFFPLLTDIFEKNAWAAGQDHLADGRIVGEVLAQLRFSALSSELVLFPTTGTITSEEVRTAEVWLYPPPGPAGTDALQSKTDYVSFDVAGVAKKDGATVPFAGQLELNDAWQPNATAGSRSTVTIESIRKVRGIPVTFFPEEGGHLEIRFDPTRLFRGADFSNLDANPTAQDGTKTLVQAKTGRVTTDQVMTNIYQGFRQSTGTYSVRWIAP